MWVKWLCILVVWDALQTVQLLRIYEGERHDQEQEKSVDQEGSASVLSPRETGPAELQHSFGVKIEHPFGKDLHGRVVEQREHHAFGKQPSVDQQSTQREIQSSQTNHANIGGEWKGISRFREPEEQQSHDLSQHQVLSHVLQGLGQVNQILGKRHQGVEQVNQMFGQDHKDFQHHKGFSHDNKELFALDVEKKREENKSFIDTSPELKFENIERDVNNNIVGNRDTTNYDFRSDSKPLQDPNIFNLPKPSEKVEVNSQGVKTITVTKEVPVPFKVEVEKQVPFKVEVPVDRPFPVERPQPFPVYVEKRVPYNVKEYVPQPYTVYRRVPYTVKVHVNKPYTVHVPKPYRVLVEKKVPYPVEKRVPYPVRVYVDKPYPIHVPVLRTIPYTVEKEVPLPVQVSVEKPYPVPVPKPYKVYVEKKVPYSTHMPMYHQQDVEGLGQSMNGDQGATLGLQGNHHHPQWRGEYVPNTEHAPMYQPFKLDQPSETVDQSYHQQPQWMEEYVPNTEHGPMYQPFKLDQTSETVDQSHHQQPQWMEEYIPNTEHGPMHQPSGSGQGQPSGTADKGATLELQSHHQHPQWRKYVPNAEHVPMYHPHEFNHPEVDELRHHQGTTDQAGTLNAPRVHQHPSWREHMPTNHLHERDQQVMEESGLPLTTEPRLRASGASVRSTPHATHNFRYLTNLSGKQRAS